MAENRKIKGKINLLQRQTEVVIDRRTAPQPKGEDAPPTIQILSPLCHLLDTEIEALRHAISDELMKSEGWVIENNGRVVRLITPHQRSKQDNLQSRIRHGDSQGAGQHGIFALRKASPQRIAIVNVQLKETGGSHWNTDEAHTLSSRFTCIWSGQRSVDGLSCKAISGNVQVRSCERFAKSKK